MHRTRGPLLILLVLAQLACGQWLHWHQAGHQAVAEPVTAHAGCSHHLHVDPTPSTDDVDPEDCRWCELAQIQGPILAAPEIPLPSPTAIPTPPRRASGRACAPATHAGHTRLARGPPSARRSGI